MKQRTRDLGHGQRGIPQLINDKSQPDVESWLVVYIIDFPIDLPNRTMALAAIFILLMQQFVPDLNLGHGYRGTSQLINDKLHWMLNPDCVIPHLISPTDFPREAYGPQWGVV